MSISRVDSVSGEALTGAHIQIIDVMADEVVREWNSTTRAYSVLGLKTNTNYQLKETVAPAGYTLASVTSFTIDGNGVVTTSATQNDDGVILIEDAMTEVYVAKIDLGSDEKLAGATIQVLDKDGNVVEEWTSSTDTHVIKGKLNLGETYTLKETAAPEGYKVTATTTFTLGMDGSITDVSTSTTDENGKTVILMSDEMTKISVSKVDRDTGEELAGAHIQILDGKGSVVEDWDSDMRAHEVTGLKVGEEYTLHETAVPDGYTLVADTTFTIGETGTVTSTGSMTEDGVLLVEDAKTKVSISKVDAANRQELAGAHLQVLDDAGNVVEEWDSDKAVHVIEGLMAGEKYTLHETVAPEGYLLASDTTFTIDETGKVTTTGGWTTNESGNFVVLVEDPKTCVRIDKVDLDTKKLLAGAHIVLKDAKGIVVEEWDSTTTAHELQGLKTGVTYTLTETKAPKGYTAIAGSVAFTIDDKGTVTVASKKDAKGNEIAMTAVGKDDVTTISIEDKKETSSTPEKASKPSASTSTLAKTGDPAAMTGLATLLLSAAGSGLVTTGVFSKRRNRSRR